MTRIYVLKEDLGMHPRFEEFKQAVYDTQEAAKDYDVLSLLDGYEVAVYNPETDFLDAALNESFMHENMKVDTEFFMSEVIPTFFGDAPVEVKKVKHKKRKKGARRMEATVNKATIVYNGSVEYTVKDFVSMEVTAEKTVFVMEDNTKGTVNYRQAITVPNDDVVGILVRGINHEFGLDMHLTNMGIVVFHADNVEMETRSINIVV